MTLLNFTTIKQFQGYLENEISDIKNKFDIISKTAGEKIRQKEKEFESDKEFLSIKEKLENKTDEKKKKKTKRNISNNWINYGEINLYNGMGTKGELELYFKEIEILKSRLTKLESTKKSLEDLQNKGLKNNLNCMVYNEQEKYEMVLIKTTDKKREKFSFKTEFSLPAQTNPPLFLESALK